MAAVRRSVGPVITIVQPLFRLVGYPDMNGIRARSEGRVIGWSVQRRYRTPSLDR
jgi:hypothetical protein